MVELLDERIESGEDRVDGRDRLLLAVDHLSADDFGELFPTSQQVRVGYGFGSQVLPCVIELGCAGWTGSEYGVEALDRARVCVSGEQTP